MAGLMNPQGAAVPPTQGAAPPDGDASDEQDETPNVTPQEQQAYESFVKAGFALIYGGGKVRPSILKLLDDDPKDLMAVLPKSDELKNFSPVAALAGTAVVVTLEVVRQSGEKDEGVILHGGKALLEDLAEVAEKSGIHPYAQEEINQAMLMGADMYREAATADGLVDENQLKQQFAEMQQAGKEGRIGDLIPQFRDPQQAAAAPASPAPEPDQDTPQQDQSQDPAMNPDAQDDEEQRQ